MSLLEEADDITGLLDDLVVVNNEVNGNSVQGTDIVTQDVTVSGLHVAVISSDEEGNLDYSDYNEIRDNALNVTISTSVEDVHNEDIESLEEYAIEHGMNQTQLSFDINVNKSYGNINALLNNNLMSITELPMDVALTFELPDSSKNYKLLHEHNGKIQELDVLNDGNKGIAFTNQFSSFMLVEYDSNETTNNNDTVMNSNTWDDGGPFTTDACGSVYDRWGNKLYDAGACDIDSNNGYKLVNTSDK